MGKTEEMVEYYESAKALARKLGKAKLTLRVLRNMHKACMDTFKIDLAGRFLDYLFGFLSSYFYNFKIIDFF